MCKPRRTRRSQSLAQGQIRAHTCTYMVWMRECECNPLSLVFLLLLVLLDVPLYSTNALLPASLHAVSSLGTNPTRLPTQGIQAT